MELGLHAEDDVLRLGDLDAAGDQPARYGYEAGVNIDCRGAGVFLDESRLNIPV